MSGALGERENNQDNKGQNVLEDVLAGMQTDSCLGS